MVSSNPDRQACRGQCHGHPIGFSSGRFVTRRSPHSSIRSCTRLCTHCGSCIRWADSFGSCVPLLRPFRFLFLDSFALPRSSVPSFVGGSPHGPSHPIPFPSLPLAPSFELCCHLFLALARSFGRCVPRICRFVCPSRCGCFVWLDSFRAEHEDGGSEKVRRVREGGDGSGLNCDCRLCTTLYLWMSISMVYLNGLLWGDLF